MPQRYHVTGPAAPKVRTCCGEAMLDVTEADDRALGLRVWLCSVCKAEPVEADGQPPPRLAPEPTAAVPGSPEKIEAMRRRVRKGLDACHLGDAQGTSLRPGARRGARTNAGGRLAKGARDLPTGVSRARGRFRARYRHRGKQIDLGLYLTAAEAAEALRLARADDGRDLAS